MYGQSYRICGQGIKNLLQGNGVPFKICSKVIETLGSIQNNMVHMCMYM